MGARGGGNGETRGVKGAGERDEGGWRAGGGGGGRDERERGRGEGGSLEVELMSLRGGGGTDLGRTSMELAEVGV